MAGCQTSEVKSFSLDHSPDYFARSLLLSVKVPGGSSENKNNSNNLPPQVIRGRIDTFRFYFERILTLIENNFLNSNLRMIINELQTEPFDSFERVDELLHSLNKEIQSQLVTHLNNEEKRTQLFNFWKSWTPNLSFGSCRLQNSFTALEDQDLENHYILTRQGWNNCMGWTALHFINNKDIPAEIFHGITLEQAQLINEKINDSLKKSERKIDFPKRNVKPTTDFTRSIGYYKYTDQEIGPKTIHLYRPRNNSSIPLPSHIGFQRIVLILTDLN